MDQQQQQQQQEAAINWIEQHIGTISTVILLLTSTLGYHFNIVSIDNHAFMLLLVLLGQTGWLGKMNDKFNGWVDQILNEYDRQLFEQMWVFNRRNLLFRHHVQALVVAFYR